MDLLKKALLIGAGFGASTLALWSHMTREAYRKDVEVQEPLSTSIVLPTLNEANYLQKTLNSLAQQTVNLTFPEKLELIIVDSGSTDKTVDIAKIYGRVIENAPPGKLSARDLGIKEAKGEVIVAVDADVLYPQNFLNLILSHFWHDSKVVAVSSPRLYHPSETPIYLSVAKLWHSLFEGLLSKRMLGSNSAFLKNAYLESGGFDLSINQLDRKQLVTEEEYRLTEKLTQYGKYVYEFRASIFASPRHLPHSLLPSVYDGARQVYMKERREAKRF